MWALDERVESLEQLQKMIAAAFDGLNETELVTAFESATLAGRVTADEETGNAD